MEKNQSLAVPLGRMSLSAVSVWQGGCGHWAGGMGLPRSRLGLVENKVQLKLLMFPFRLVVGSGDTWMPVPWCYAWVNRFALSDPHSLPASSFPGAPHWPFQETTCSLQLSCPQETTSWVGFLCRSSAGPPVWKIPVLSVQRRQDLCLEGQRSLSRLLSNRKESRCSPEHFPGNH